MSDYLQRTWDFLKWHKKKFIALGTVTAVGVGGYYYAKRMVLDSMRQVEELGRGLQEKMMETQYRESELARVRKECSSMILTFVPPLRGMVKKLTDPKPVTERLKAVRLRRKNEGGTPTAQDEEEVMQLWDELKVVSLARLIVSVYALGLLNCVLRIQLHILGRYAFEEAISQRRAEAKAEAEARKLNQPAVENGPTGDQGEDDGSASSGSSDESTGLVSQRLRESFLFSGSDHFMNSGNGMEVMLRHVQNAIQQATVEWNMGTDATVNRWDILNMIDKIRSQIEGCGEPKDGLRLSAQTRQWIVKCLVPEDEEGILGPDRELSPEQNAILRDMLEETLDMIESPNFALAAEQTFDRLFDVLHKVIQNRPFEVYRRVKKEQIGDSNKAEEDDEEDRFSLTKIIVNLKVASGHVLEEGSTRAPGSPTDGFASGDEMPSAPRSDFQQSLSDIPALDDLCNAVFQQGTDADSSLDDLGLGALGLGEDDLGSLASLLGGLGGMDDGNEAELMKLLTQSFMGGNGGGLGSGGPGGPGGIDDAQMMQMLQSLTAQGFEAGQGAPGNNTSNNNLMSSSSSVSSHGSSLPQGA